MEAQSQRSEQANRYAEVVRGVNKALVSGSQDQFDAVNAFLAACPEEDNGQLRHDLMQTQVHHAATGVPARVQYLNVCQDASSCSITLLLHPEPSAQSLHSLFLSK